MHKIPDAQRAFKFTLEFGETPGALPVAEVVQWGNGLWVKVCPLCGLVHECRGGIPTDGIFKPQCIVKQLVPSVYKEWLEKYPQARDFDRVRLTGLDEIKLLPTAKPQRRDKQGRTAA